MQITTAQCATQYGEANQNDQSEYAERRKLIDLPAGCKIRIGRPGIFTKNQCVVSFLSFVFYWGLNNSVTKPMTQTKYPTFETVVHASICTSNNDDKCIY